MLEPTTVTITILAHTVAAAKASVPPLKAGWKRVYEDLEEFSPYLCHQVRIAILDKEDQKK